MNVPDTIPGGGSVADVPAELRERRQWVGWRLVHRGAGKKPTKVPIDPSTGRGADCTDPATWGALEDALALVEHQNCDGVSFALSPLDPYVGIDLDDVIDPESGLVDDDAIETVESFATYTELSPSRTGLHVWLKGSLAGLVGRKRGDRECYDRARFMTVTGLSWSVTKEIAERQALLSKWHAATFPPLSALHPREAREVRSLNLTDSEVLARVRRSKQAGKFEPLWAGDTSAYASGSEADLALCSILSFWCGKDAAAVDRLFRASGLARPKWDSRRGDSTYGAKTVAKAVATGESYDPAYRSNGAAPTILFPAQANGNGKHPERTSALRGVSDTEPPPEELTADDVAGIDDLKRAGAEIKWVWHKWIQSGVVTAVAAEGGTGKTRFVADLVRRACAEQKWPDGTPVEVAVGQTVALWVVSDNHHDEMVTLCDSFGISDFVKLNATKSDPYGGVTLDAPEEFAALERRARAVKPLFIVVDTVGNATDRNLSRQEDAKAFYQPLQLIARKLHCAVMALTHLNAGGKILGRRALEKVRTCIRMNAAADRTNAKRRLEVIKSNSVRPEPLGMVMSDARNDYDDDPPPPPEDMEGGHAPNRPDSKKKECADWLRELIQAKLSVKVTETRQAAQNAGFSVDCLYAAKRLLKLDETKTNGYMWWRFRDEAQNSD